MPIKIPPVIATKQQLYDYMGVDTIKQALPIESGTIFSDFATYLLQITAQQIVEWIGYDYTNGQVMVANFNGNNSALMEIGSPGADINTISYIDNTNQSAGVQILSPSIVTIQPPYLNYILRNDGQNWDAWCNYFVEYTQATDPIWGGWPSNIIQVQLEMCAIIWTESYNSNSGLNLDQISIYTEISMLGIAEIHNYLGIEGKMMELTPRWKARLRTQTKYAI